MNPLEMAEEQTQENNAPTQNNKYVFVAVALIVIGVLVYFVYSGNRKTEVEVPEEMSMNNESETPDQAEEDEDSEEETVLGDSTVEEIYEPVVVEEEKLPDLYIKKFEFDDDPKQNEEVTVKITFGNKGTAMAEDFDWEWWATEDDKGCEDDIDELGVDDTKTVECDYTYTESDTYESRVIVDSEDDVTELDEDNNEDTEEVTPEEEKRADLYISEYSFDPVPEKAVPFTVRIGIKNQGNKAAGEFYWEWWPTAYGYACREKISELAPNSEKVVTCDYTYGGWSNYPTKAVVDADDDVEEFDEGNNSYTENVVPIH